MKKANEKALLPVKKPGNTLKGMGGQKRYDLMTGVSVPPCEGAKDGKHIWANVVRPPCSRSGLCEDMCLTCGVSVEYDTSD